MLIQCTPLVEKAGINLKKKKDVDWLVINNFRTKQCFMVTFSAGDWSHKLTIEPIQDKRSKWDTFQNLFQRVPLYFTMGMMIYILNPHSKFQHHICQ